ncbi:transmembrane protein 65 isoform X2 [Culicoides brevitarsis]|uniref:transmembrane protein 65 isoform X2 n=1 Tax=Culicoides brevitarsis TaxID=469753 RepID=UPI00307B5396
MSSVRSVLCGRTLLRSSSQALPSRQLATVASLSTNHNQQSFDVRYNKNYCGLIHKSKLLLSRDSVSYSGRSRYTTALSNMTKDQANELVFRLNDSERQILLQVLNRFESNKERQRLEGELAASRWRSKFGRPKMHVLGNVDPTGSYCRVPENWLKKQLVDSTPPPTTNDLTKLMIINSLPFIGFGFLDNFTMIVAGEYIEHSIAGIITISTMAAAGLGNTISDVIGIGFSSYVERLAERVGIRPPNLTPIQMEMKSSRRASNLGRVLGITVGCLLGMCPLLFTNSNKNEKPTDVSVSAALDEETVTEANT